ncbi:MAG TPA: YggS family pyridoxal phosphate-dependent enzyme [Spirochaetota bacterium]|nr:YggS family pyridoxal phosphate-dependent enzyme [Spirochaetota bacterium]HOL56859.1 YggS family pyridoxal phosphate-dependent enzyme [Spirochaetota bacterium]HPP03361.1 YggS family pyridoxal phosphate-dependent enzyme [Spirochaetota bacterium]
MTIRENIFYLLEKIESIKTKNNISYDIKLMAVTKTHPVEYVLETIDAGITLFGENRVLEAYEKFNSEKLKDKNFELHIIGHLQRNKAKEAAQICQMIQSIDKIETLEVVEKYCQQLNKKIDYLIEVNTSNEPQKYGINPDLLNFFIENILKKDFKFCNLRGLMTVGPLTNNIKTISFSFKLLYNLYDSLKKNLNKKDFDILSMGMSGDYEIAIKEGSNLLRIGSAIYGSRN